MGLLERRRSYASAGLPAGTTFDFDYTGTVQEVELPKGRYLLQCWGAQGGDSYTGGAVGSKGGYSEGVLNLTEATTLYAFVGGQGGSDVSSGVMKGGWNGGGSSYTSVSASDDELISYPGTGGGSTDLATVTSDMSYSSNITNRSSESYLSRCIVAGGGAGGSYTEGSITITQQITIGEWSDIESSPSYPGNLTGLSLPLSTMGASLYLECGDITSLASWDVAGCFIAVRISLDNSYSYNVNVYPNSTKWVDPETFGSNWKNYSIKSIHVHNVCYYTDESDPENSWGYLTKYYLSYFRYYYKSSSTSLVSVYSNASQQGGGTSGKGWGGATQSAGGSGWTGGKFGYGTSQTYKYHERYTAGAGGGGWYGGGCSSGDSSSDYLNYSGGGSGFVNIAANASYRPSGYTGLELESGETIDGSQSFPSVSGGTEVGHAGNGYARITVL